MLISTYYNEEGLSYKTVYDGKKKIKDKLSGDGDFRNSECINILKEADIIITNPPFSLFRDFIEVIINNKKEFLIIGNQNAITCKEIFRLIKENKLWTGINQVKEFSKPDGTTQVFGNVCWFCNLDNKKRHENIILSKRYNEKDYIKYDNYNAINVNKLADIPLDYDGYMGVPITFISKYNPEQFDIIGNSRELAEDMYINGEKVKNTKRFYINEKELYDRVVIRKI